MKKILVISMLLISEIASAQSLTDPMRDVNNQLRAMFSPLARPTPARLFLHEMSAHMVDSVFFTHYSTDTSNLDNWLFLNREMFYSAYDTLALEPADSIYKRGNQFRNDTIPIGIMDYDFYTFKPDALTTNIYFNFDTINDVLSDKAGRPGFPYNINNLFAAAPLVVEAQSAEVTYRIDPAFIFTDAFNQGNYIPGGTTLKIDFGDGTGWHVFAGNAVEYHDALYTSDGFKTVKVAICDPDGVPVKLSTSRIYTPNVVFQHPDQEITILNGVNVGIYHGCSDVPFNKVVIYVEGFDPLDVIPSMNRTMSEIYTERIQEPELAQLRNFGYTFIVVDWKRSGLAIQQNAMSLVSLINYIKCNLIDPANDNQFVVIGESMGGLVARYALTFMETPMYDAPCFREKMHNTRLLMTFDSPHQGASLPLAFQWMYLDGIRLLHQLLPISTREIARSFNIFLNSMAAQQMLIYHIDTRLTGAGSYSSYNSHPERYIFLGDLASIGNYPRYCKTVAMSDGSLSGKRQTNDYNGNPRVANDDLMNIAASSYITIFRQRLQLYGAQIRLRSNPSGTGEVYRLEAGSWRIRIRLRRWRVVAELGLNNLLSTVRGAVNVRDYCTSAGGLYNFGLASADDAATNMNWFHGIFRNRSVVNDGNGNYHVTGSWYGNWFGSNSVIHSEGIHFGFIPTYSALDYSTGGLPNYNIETEPIALKVLRTPFDVIMGIPDVKTGLSVSENIFKNQMEHCDPLNSALINNLGVISTYRSCRTTPIIARVLNREIGDEEMWLDNMTLNRRAMYESEYDIHVNRNNPYYEYVNQPNLPADAIVDGAYSKSRPFIIAPPNGLAIFKYDDVNSTSGPNSFTYDAPFSGSYQQVSAPMINCCQNYKSFLKLPKQIEAAASSMQIFPNPVNDESIRIKFRLKKYGAARLRIMNTLGEELSSRTVLAGEPGNDTYLAFDLSELNLQQGMYIVVIENTNERISAKLIIQ